MGRPFARVLVANRGEIALRVVRACHDAGLSSVAVYAEEDAASPYVKQAGTAVALAGHQAAETYLNIDQLIAAGRSAGVDAVHPGYGFLSENADFAQAVMDAGMVWIGPPPSAIRELGNKLNARLIAARVGAPLLPSTPGPIGSAAEVLDFANQHGLPVAIKAAFGGGGRGLKIARTRSEIPQLFESAVREATAAFGHGECFVERFMERARHVEAQVLADEHGGVVVVGTRDCSLQRRHQKLVEEAPAPFITNEQRARIHEAAEAICAAGGYRGAGTVEFLMDAAGALSFLEVNTRLQVEHTVTEETTGLDLVREQFRLAAGGDVPPRPADPNRHAIEFRLNAEDPATGFLPSTGTLLRFEPPSGPGVRLDAGVGPGSVVTDRFDSLLAKLVIVGTDRTQALQRARRALDEFEVSGVATVLPFLRAVVADPAFAGPDSAGFTVHTRWIEEDWAPRAKLAPAARPTEPFAVQVGGRWLDIDLPGLVAAEEGPLLEARHRARQRSSRATEAAGNVIVSPMQGTIADVSISEGQYVHAGDLLAVVEAMKMENPLRAPHDGWVVDLAVAVGDGVTQGAPLCRVDPSIAVDVERNTDVVARPYPVDGTIADKEGPNRVP